MPGKVKVRILAGRNLPVMDRSSDTTDAYVEVKLGNTTHKTDVYRKSLNPQWNSEWFIFEIDDLELQDEPLQIRLMDHDTYSTNDAIGKVYLDLNPLLLAPNHPTQGKNTQDVPNSAGAAVMSGWLPVYDTMHGIRGEVSVLVKVDLFSDFNKFRQSSCGVQFFFTPGIPVGFRCNSIIGFVEELVVNDDPEYKWIDRIRTPRASNEARQTLFSKLSGELQRRIGLKVLEQGGNSVIGYRQCFDLEGESGIVVRGIGSVVSLAKIMYEGAAGVTSAHSPSPLREYGTAQRDSVDGNNFMLDNLYVSVPNSDQLLPFSVVRVAKLFPQSLLSYHYSFVSPESSAENSSAMQYPSLQNIVPFTNTKDDECCPQLFNFKAEKRPDPLQTGLYKPQRKGKSLPIEPRKRSATLTVLPPLHTTQFVQPMSSLDIPQTKNKKRSLSQSAMTKTPLKRGIFGSSYRGDKKQKGNSSLSKGIAEDCETIVRGKREAIYRPVKKLVSKIRKSSEVLHLRNILEQTLIADDQMDTISNSDDDNISITDAKETLSRSLSDPTLNRSTCMKHIFQHIGNAEKNNDLLSSLTPKKNIDDEYFPLEGRTEFFSNERADMFKKSSEACNDDSCRVDLYDVSGRKIAAQLDITEDLSSPIVEEHLSDRSKTEVSCSNSLLYVTPGSLPDIKLVPSSPLPLRSSSTQNSPKKDTDVVSSESDNEVASVPRRQSPFHMFYLPSEDDLDTTISYPHNVTPYYHCSSCMLNFKNCSCAVSADCIPPPFPLPAILSSPPSPSFLMHASDSLVEPGIEPFRSGFFPSAASPKRGSRSRKTSGSYSMSRSPQLQEGAEPSPVNAQTSGGTQSPTHSIKMTSPSHTGGVYINRRSSDSDLSITPKGGSLTESGGSSVGILGCCTRPLMSQESFDNLIYPFLTMKSFPSGFIIHIGGTVCSRSVQLLDRGHLPEEAETRDCWWSDLRTEIRSHARCLGCNVVIGYEEFTSISDEVCLLNAVGTAAVINVRYHDLETLTKMSQKGAKESFPVFSDKKDFESSPHPQMPGSTGKGSSSSCKDTQMCNRLKPSSPRPLKRLISTTVSRSHPNVLEDTGESSGSCPGTALPKQPVHPTLSGPRYPPCTMCHIPYVEDLNPMKTTIVKCALCRKHKVPDVILATIELPPNIPITGRGCFIQARVIRAKKDLKGEANAREMSDAMPFLEYDLHKQLYQKLMMKGFNAIFALRIRVTIGEKFIVGVGTGTGVFLTALPPPSLPRVTSRMPEDGCRKSEIQKKIQLSFEKNREIYGVNEIHYEGRHVSQSKGSDSEDSDEDLDVDVHSGNKDMYDLDLNDLEDAEMINLLLEENPPEHITVVTTQVPPGFTPERTVNIQMFTKVWRSKLPQSLTRILFSSYFDNLLQSIYFKLRNLSPYIVSGLKFNVGLKEDEVQISLCGMVLGHSSHQPLPPPPNAVHSQPLRHADKSRSEPKKAKQDDGDLIFRMEEVCLNEERPASKTASQKLVTQPVKNVILVSQSNSSSQSFHSVPSDGSAFPSESSAGSVSSDSSSGRPPTKLKCEAPPHPSHASSKSDHFGVEITPLSFIPGAKIEKHLGNLNFFFIRESTNLKESGGLNGFMGSFVTEVLALVRANVAAIGGNAMISYFLSKCELQYNLHKSQGQCLINVGGDIVYAQYSSSSCKAISDRCDASQQPTSAVPTTASASSVFT